jgi:hypothetical protein
LEKIETLISTNVYREKTMRRKKGISLTICLVLLMVTGNGLTSPVPDTGQSKCYDNSVETLCPSPGQPYYGQDSNYDINSQSFTKLDGNGVALPDDALSWVMVKDNVTGLIWETKANKDGVQNYGDPHDADNTYTWYDSNPNTNGGYSGTPGNGTDTEGFIKALNNARYGGYSDWRLPTVNELSYIVDRSLNNPSINMKYFPNTTMNYYYLSSTTYTHSPYCAWSVWFSYGICMYEYKSDTYGYARAVRGGHSGVAGRWGINNDGTVSDYSTGLMWQQATVKNMTWDQALAYCENLSLAGHTDWRLPNIHELISLSDYGKYNPAIDINAFPDTASDFYWSSTNLSFTPGGAWLMGFHYGNNIFGNDKQSQFCARAVRGGQAESVCTPTIKANGHDGAVIVSPGFPVSITASLSPGEQSGKSADWWIAAGTSSAWYSLTYPTGWLLGIYPIIQYPLIDLSPAEVVNGSLPAGDYDFIFGVDLSPNGVLDLPLYYDFVQVHVGN